MGRPDSQPSARPRRWPGAAQPGQAQPSQASQARPSQARRGPVRRGYISRRLGLKTLTTQPNRLAAAASRRCAAAAAPSAAAAVPFAEARRLFLLPPLLLWRIRAPALSPSMEIGRQGERRPSPASKPRNGGNAQERPVASPFTEEEMKPAPRASAGGRALRCPSMFAAVTAA